MVDLPEQKWKDFGEGWASVINDPKSQSHCFKLPSDLVFEKTNWSFDALFDKAAKVNRETAKGRDGKVLRRSAWYTMPGCSCPY